VEGQNGGGLVEKHRSVDIGVVHRGWGGGAVDVRRIDWDLLVGIGGARSAAARPRAS